MSGFIYKGFAVPTDAQHREMPDSELPTRISISIDPREMRGSASISAIHFAGTEPPNFDPRTAIVLPRISCAERDQAVGAYLAAWNKIEAKNEFLIARSLRLEMWEAAPITTLNLNANAFCDMLLGIGEQKLEKSTATLLSRYLDGYKVRNTKRNELYTAHGFATSK